MLAIVRGGFTDADVRTCENKINEQYLEKLRNATSEVGRQQVTNSSTTVEARMIKVGDRRLEGFAKISLHDQESRDLGLDEIMQTCEATMETNSSQYIWKCNVK
jgi:hypothetical protein